MSTQSNDYETLLRAAVGFQRDAAWQAEIARALTSQGRLLVAVMRQQFAAEAHARAAAVYRAAMALRARGEVT